jgi:hypothetical protein
MSTVIPKPPKFLLCFNRIIIIRCSTKCQPTMNISRNIIIILCICWMINRNADIPTVPPIFKPTIHRINWICVFKSRLFYNNCSQPCLSCPSLLYFILSHNVCLYFSSSTFNITKDVNLPKDYPETSAKSQSIEE